MSADAKNRTAMTSQGSQGHPTITPGPTSQESSRWQLIGHRPQSQHLGCHCMTIILLLSSLCGQCMQQAMYTAQKQEKTSVLESSRDAEGGLQTRVERSFWKAGCCFSACARGTGAHPGHPGHIWGCEADVWWVRPHGPHLLRTLTASQGWAHSCVAPHLLPLASSWQILTHSQSITLSSFPLHLSREH